MPAWMRLGWWGVVASGLAFGSQVQAGPLTRGGESFNWTNWGPGRDLSPINQTTAVSSWSRSTITYAPGGVSGPVVARPATNPPVVSPLPSLAPQTVTTQAPSVGTTTPDPVYVLPPSIKLADWHPQQSLVPAVTPAPQPVYVPAPAPLPIPSPAPAPVQTAPSPPPTPYVFPFSAPQNVYNLPPGIQLAPWSPPPGTPMLAGSAPVTTPAVEPTAAAPSTSQNIPAFGTTPGSTATPVNAFVNLGNGPFADAAMIANTTPSPWFNNPIVQGFFGGAPTPQQQADFASTVLARVQAAFQQSGINVALTSDPTVPAAHTLSLVSLSQAQALPNAIGMTDVGGNGLSFLDQQAPAAHSLSQLEWIAAHNIAHELMLSFGVRENYDATGNFLDARNAFWTMMVDPSAKFSPAAIDAINQALAQTTADTGQPSPQLIDARPVPEPGALAVWCAVTLSLVIGVRRRTARS